MASPLLGYNTNVRHHGNVFHIQTEDSGSGHGHIFTHLFADGGRIIATKKTNYAQYLGTDRYPDVVKRLMKESHKAMFIALRDGLFDGDEQAGARAIAEMPITLEEDDDLPDPGTDIDVEALEKAAEARLARARTQQRPRASLTPGKYAPTRRATTSSRPAPRTTPVPDPSSESIFGGDLLSEKSLDEVILSYLAEDLEDEG
ncbi:MAG: hypothetical protein ACFCGT_19455 [Sandaracinaceae bacterium]